MSFSENLRSLRESAGLSRKDMAERLHVHPNAYGMYENGYREPNLEKLLTIASVLNTTTDELLGYTLNEFERCKRILEAAGAEITYSADGGLLVKAPFGADDPDAPKHILIGVGTKENFINLINNAQVACLEKQRDLLFQEVRAIFKDLYIKQLKDFLSRNPQLLHEESSE